MIRTLPFLKTLIPLAAAALLAGCVTGDYAYRNGARGDYYYGQPSTEYRYHGYGTYGGYYPYGPSYRYGYGYPYGYGHRGYPYYHGGHYGYPYYGPRPPVVVRPRPDGSNPPSTNRPGNGAPWRNLDQLRRRQQAGGTNNAAPRMVAPARPAVTPRNEGGSRLDQVIRRSGEGRARRQSDERQEQ